MSKVVDVQWTSSLVETASAFQFNISAMDTRIVTIKVMRILGCVKVATQRPNSHATTDNVSREKKLATRQKIAETEVTKPPLVESMSVTAQNSLAKMETVLAWHKFVMGTITVVI
jgi:hypothetical protein